MIFPIYHIKHKILTSVIAPHGITDLIHAAQMNNTRRLLSVNALCVGCSFGLSQNDEMMLALDTFFLIFSLIHFRHDFPVIFKNGYQELQQYVCSLFIILSFIENHELFFWYMSCVHVPNHYYSNRQVIKRRCMLNLSFILGFSLFLSIVGEQYVSCNPILFPFYKGVVISHVIYQELYVHPRLSR